MMIKKKTWERHERIRVIQTIHVGLEWRRWSRYTTVTFEFSIFLEGEGSSLNSTELCERLRQFMMGAVDNDEFFGRNK